MLSALSGMWAMAPEVVLSLTVLLIICVDVLLSRERSYLSGWIAVAGLLAASGWGVHQWMVLGRETGSGASLGFSGMIASDRFGLFFRVLFYVSTLAVVGMSLRSRELYRMRSGEYYTLLLTATLGACLLVSSANLLMLYLAMETLSLPSYILAGYRKGSRQAAEASLKYILFGAVASGVLIYGLSLLYGLTGSLQLSALTGVSQANYSAFLLTMVLVIAGFGFKMSAVPFHFWAPDVYEGAPTPVTAYLSVVSKAAGFAVFLRVLAPYFDVTHLVSQAGAPMGILSMRFDLVSIFWILAVLTMSIGNFVALRQTDIKRLLAYSSIAHAGYMLTAFVANNQAGFHAVMFYFVVYALANLGIFAAAIAVANTTGSYRISDYRGLFFRSPLLGVTTGVLLWSLIGLPPSAGFVGKWKLFYAVVQRGQESPLPFFYYSLVLIAVLNSVVSLYYYIGIIKVMSFAQPEETSREFRLGLFEKGFLCACAVLVLALQLNWQPLSKLTIQGMDGERGLAAGQAPSALVARGPAEGGER